MSYKILITDDDEHIGDMLDEVLTKEGYITLRAYSGTEALFVLSQNKPDLILLDLMLPGLSGEEILPKIQDVPVIVISCKVGIDDKVKLLLNGASDYLTKPFNTSELLARIAVRLREKSSRGNSGEICYDELKLNVKTREFFAGDEHVHLTITEFAILKVLILNPRQVIPKSRILDLISLDTPDCTESSLKVHISNLRNKIKSHINKEYIEAIWGIGFRLE